LPPAQPLQFQLNVAPVLAEPDHVKTVEAFVVEGSIQIVVAEALKGLVGVLLIVTCTLVIGEVQVGEPGLVISKVIVFVPVEFQLTVCGPCPVGFPPIQPLQLQLNVAVGNAFPVHVNTEDTFVVDGDIQITEAETLKVLEGVGSTLMMTVVTGEVQEVAPGFTTSKVIVLFPVEFQLTVWGPAPTGFPPIQALQFQL